VDHHEQLSYCSDNYHHDYHDGGDSDVGQNVLLLGNGGIDHYMCHVLRAHVDRHDGGYDTQKHGVEVKEQLH
jgi:hypothetical protein